MKKTKGFLLTAGLGLALAFILSCSSGEDGGGGGGGGIVPGPSVTYGDETYQTVVIGTQTWFARNLNYNPGTGNSACYSNQASNCAEYGRLYDWATAMALPLSCNSSTSTCSGQISNPHPGICPSGWHIPSNDDWAALENFVGSSSTAGRYLKATSNWNSYNGASGNGQDTYGFSALPGGIGYSGGSFRSVGDGGYWWSSNEDKDNASYAYLRNMYYNYEFAGWLNRVKIYLFSVRCVKD